MAFVNHGVASCALGLIALLGAVQISAIVIPPLLSSKLSRPMLNQPTSSNCWGAEASRTRNLFILLVIFIG